MVEGVGQLMMGQEQGAVRGEGHLQITDEVCLSEKVDS